MKPISAGMCLGIVLLVGVAFFNRADAQEKVPFEDARAVVLVGTWMGRQTGTRGGYTDATYYFELQGNSLLGHAAYDHGIGMLSNIRFNGKELTFVVTYQTTNRNNNTTANYTLKLIDDNALNGAAVNNDTGNTFEVRLRKAP